MKNKYLTISDSAETDSLGNFYPDLMTFPINRFRFNNIPITTILTSQDVDRFDLFVYAYYNTSDYTDILLWINNKSSIHEFVAGDEIILPDFEDINKFYLNYFV